MGLELLGAIPDLQSAIKVDGGDGGNVRLQLDLYLDDAQKLVEISKLRGKELVVTFRA